MYRFHSTTRRIDWLFRKYASEAVNDVKQFVQLVNRVYYHHFAALYEERYVADIERQYDALINKLDLRSQTDLTIIDVGGGSGFEYEQFKRNNVRWQSFVFIEPDAEMARLFQLRADAENRNVEIMEGTLEDFADQLEAYRHKLIVFNSCLHHVIWIEPLLDIIKRTVRVGDYLLICHEPNNRYVWSPLMFVNYTIRCFTTDFLLRRCGVSLSLKHQQQQSRWDQINSDLVAQNVVCQPLPPLVIRRIIDYGVGSKGDWKTIRVPDEFDEGHWTPRDLLQYLGPDFDTLFLRTYRALGDPGHSPILAQLDSVCDRLFPQSGSVFSFAVQRKS